MQAPGPGSEIDPLDGTGSLPVYHPIAVPPGGGSGRVYSGRCLLGGWALYAGGAAAAAATLVNGGDAGGTPAGGLNIPAGQGTSYTAPGAGILCDSGLYLNVTSGTLVGALYVAPLV